MKIIFNLIGCNLANNGGSQTIIRMAEELKNLGNEVTIATNKNYFTWFKPSDGLIKLYNNIQEVPECDYIIATACSTVDSTLEYPKVPIDKKLYWMRGYEIWAMSESRLASGYQSGLKMLANSEWQREMLYSKFGVESKIQYSGIPIREIEQYVSNKKKSKKLVIGALYNKKPMKRFSDVLNICNEVYKKDIAKEFIFFGDSDFNFDLNKEYKLPITYFKQPNMERKIKMMSSCDIWLSTSVNEGLHIPPLEAGLSGCLLVARNFNSSGISDYAINEITAKTYLSNNEAVEKICEYYEELGNNDIHNHWVNLKYFIENKICDIETNAKKFAKILREIK